MMEVRTQVVPTEGPLGRIAPWAFGAAVFAGTFNNFAGGIILVVAFGLALAVLGQIRIGVLSVCYGAILALVAVHAVLPNVTHAPVRAEEAARALCFAATAAVALMMSDQQRQQALMVVVALVIVPIPIYAALGFFGRIDESGNLRYTSFFTHPNHLSYVAVILMICVIVARKKIFGDQRAWFWTVLAGLLLAIGLSESSNGLVTAAIVLVVFGLTRLRGPLWGAALLVGGIFVVGIALGTPLLDALWLKIANMDPTAIMQGSLSGEFGGHDSSLAWRASYWIAIWREHFSQDLFHILWGYGGGSTSRGNYVFEFMQKDPHNDVLAFVLDYGLIIGLAVPVLMILPVIRTRAPILLGLALGLPMQTGNIATEFSVVAVFILAIAALQVQPSQAMRPDWGAGSALAR
jgi:hypothetical protein